MPYSTPLYCLMAYTPPRIYYLVPPRRVRPRELPDILCELLVCTARTYYVARIHYLIVYSIPRPISRPVVHVAVHILSGSGGVPELPGILCRNIYCTACHTLPRRAPPPAVSHVTPSHIIRPRGAPRHAVQRILYPAMLPRDIHYPAPACPRRTTYSPVGTLGVDIMPAPAGSPRYGAPDILCSRQELPSTLRCMFHARHAREHMLPPPIPYRAYPIRIVQVAVTTPAPCGAPRMRGRG
jgi:hypothetical protein